MSEWLRDLDGQNLAPEQRAMAADAVRHIGAPAVPFLVERLSEVQLKQYQVEIERWRRQRQASEPDLPRPPFPRREALAALDALGAVGASALPALEKLLEEDPPDSQALYLAARMGPAGAPLLNRYLTSTNLLLQLEAKVCFELIRSHSEVLYPQIPVGPEAPSFDRRTCEFNVKLLQAASQRYIAQHPEGTAFDGGGDTPPPRPPVLPP